MDDEKEKYEKESEEEHWKHHENKKYDGEHIALIRRDYFMSRRTMWLIAGGALGALAVIGIVRALKKKRSAAVGIVKEGYAFKEWVASNIERAKEDMEDIAAEAKHEYYKELEAAAGSVRRERELLQKIEEKIEERMARHKAENGGE